VPAFFDLSHYPTACSGWYIIRRMVALLVASLVLADSGMELNAKADALYQRGDYREALKLYRKAADANPRLAAAFYNQALTLAALRRTSRVQPSKKDVLDAVETAVQLDPKLRERAEHDFLSVRTTIRGQRLLGRNVEKDTEAILKSINWHSRNGEHLAFAGDGTLRYWRDPAALPSGKWSIDGKRVSATLGKRTYEGSIDSEGVLTLDGLGRFFDW
jgi:tetratricopeptide (TPR) repeat protein